MNKVERSITFSGAALLILGVVALIIGAVGPVTGSAALISFAITSAGGVLSGLGILLLFLISGCIGIRKFSKEKPSLSIIIKEFLQFLLSVFVYCGGAFLVLLSVLSFNLKDTSLAARIFFVILGILGVIGMIAFRRFRKKHPYKSKHIGGFLTVMIPLIISVFFIFNGLNEEVKFLQDLSEDFPIEETIMEGVSTKRTSGRRTNTCYYLQGKNEKGDKLSFQVDLDTYKEWKELNQRADSPNACIRYYKNTGVVVEVDEIYLDF